MQIEWQNAGWFGARANFASPFRSSSIEGVATSSCSAIGRRLLLLFFANNPVSVRNGREVYGWPKVAMQMDDLTPILDPLDRDLVIRLNSSNPALCLTPPRRTDSCHFWTSFVNPRRFSLCSARAAILSPPRRTRWPSRSPLCPMRRALSRILEPISNSTTWVTCRQRVIWGFSTSRRLLPRVIGDRRIAPFPQPIGYAGSAINLKQFRDAENPNTACYQAITRSIMTLERLNVRRPFT